MSHTNTVTDSSTNAFKSTNFDYLPSAPVYRTYQCNKCAYITNKSRQFLLHRKLSHKENITIYGCCKCVYASKSKHKLLRHRVLVHKDTASLADITPLEGFDSFSASKGHPVTKKASKSVDGTAVELEPVIKQYPVGDSKKDLIVVSGDKSDDAVFDYISWQITSSSGAVAVGSCTLCGFSHAVKSKVFDHIKKTHFRVSSYSCDQCGFQCLSESEWAKHLDQHRSGPVLNDSLDMSSMPKLSPAPSSSSGKATRAPATMPRLSANLPAVIGSSGDLQCGICGLVVKTESRLKIHLISHSSISTWTCPLCPLRYKRPADLNRHMKRKHGVKLRDFKEKNASPQSSASETNDSRASSVVDANTDSEQDVPLDLCVKKQSSPVSDDAPLDLSRKDGGSPSYFEKQSHLTEASSPPLTRYAINCQFCSQSYSTMDELNTHVRVFHRFSPSRMNLASSSLGVVVPYPSSDSDFLNRSGESMKSYESTPVQDARTEKPLLQTERQNSLKCSYCKYVAKYRAELERHMCIHTGEKPFQCLYCSFSTIWKQDMKRHLPKQHPDEVKEYAGDLSKLIEKTHTSMKVNRRIFDDAIKEDSSEDPSIASLASLVDTSVDDLMEENNNVSPRKEPLESCYLGGSWEVKEMDQASESGSSTSQVPTGVPQELTGNICPICSCSCRTSSRLKKHMEIHENLKRFQCPYCGKRSNWHSDVRRHIARGHPGKAEKVDILSKEQAKKTLASYVSMYGESTRCLGNRVHGNPHTVVKASLPEVQKSQRTEISSHQDVPSSVPAASDKAKRYKCSHCGKLSKWKWYLQKHIKTFHSWASVIDVQANTGEPVCTICSYQCKSWSQLDKHMEIHKNLKRHMCPHCGKRSNWHADILHHIRTYHAGAESSVITLTHQQAQETLSDYLDKFGDGKRVGKSPTKTKERSLQFRRFQCSKCGKRSNWRWQLNQHVKKMHAGKAKVIELDAETAKATFSEAFTSPNSRPSRREVQALSTSYKSPESLMPESAFLDTVSHDYNEPAVAAPDRTPAAKSFMARPYKCSNCGQKARLKCHLSWHVKPGKPCAGADIISLRDQDVSSVQLVKIGRKKHRCMVCSFSTNHATALANHKKWKHRHGNHGYIMERQAVDAFSGFDQSIDSPVMDAEDSLVVDTNDTHDSSSAALSDSNWTDVDDSVSQTPSTSQPHEPAANEETKRISSVGATPSKAPADESITRFRKFMCSECGRRSNWRWNLKIHIKASHPHATIIELSEEEARATFFESVQGKKPIPKSASSPKMTNRVAATESAKLSDPSKPYACDLCPFRSSYIKSLTNHKKWKHPEAWIKILENRLASLGGKKEGNNVTQSGEAPSDTVATRDDGLNSSTQSAADIVHSSTRWQCSHCEFISSKMTVINHMRERHPNSVQYTCKICGYVCSFRGSACRHVSSKHGLAPPSCYVTPPKLVRVFRESPMKSEHTVKDQSADIAVRSLAKSSVRQPSLYDTTDGPPVNGRFKCSVCPFQSSLMKNMYHHKRYHKPRHGKKSACKYCPYYAVAPRLVLQHMRLHKVEPPSVGISLPLKKKITNVSRKKRFPGSGPLKGKTHNTLHCQLCPFISNYPSRFSFHMNLHKPHPGGNHKCPHCAYWCKQPFNLTNHLHVHSEKYIRSFRPDLVHTLANNATAENESLKLPRIESSPCKSDVSESSADEVESAGIKQKIIASKIQRVAITPSKLDHGEPSQAPACFPMPVLKEDGEVIKVGQYKSLHKCSYCPFTNARLSCLVLHEKMHIKRDVSADQPVFKCPYCSYNVSNKDLLAVHLKVHTKQYSLNPEDINDVEAINTETDKSSDNPDDSVKDNTETDKEEPAAPATADFPEKPTFKPDYPSPFDLAPLPQKSGYFVKYNDTTGEHILEKAVYKKWCCERCPYATTKKSQFEKHVLLHGSAQKFTCQFCDYSVPGYHLLLQHQRLHLSPNNNLLSVQSIANLQRLPVIPADIAAATTTPRSSSAQPDTHEQCDLYENSDNFDDSKKLFRCDRCPYSNPRRDQLLSHLKFHMISSELKCPFCNYSVSKGHLLNQHMKIHFNTPGSEMNPFKKSPPTQAPAKDRTCLTEEDAKNEFVTALQLQKKGSEEMDVSMFELPKPPTMETATGNDVQESCESAPAQEELAIRLDSPAVSPTTPPDSTKDSNIKISPDGALDLAVERKVTTAVICRYCSRDVGSEEALKKHEARHLTGSSFVVAGNSNQADNLPSEQQ